MIFNLEREMYLEEGIPLSEVTLRHLPSASVFIYFFAFETACMYMLSRGLDDTNSSLYLPGGFRG